MNYFTPERYVALQDFSSDAAMDDADAVWESAVDEYEAHLQALRPRLSTSLRQLLEGHYLHDADVLSMGRHGNDFVITLQLGAPPNDLLTISYAITAEPVIDTNALPPAHCSPRPHWLYDELSSSEQDGQTQYLHSFLLSNGWEVQLRFRDVQMATAQPVYPVARTVPQAQSA